MKRTELATTHQMAIKIIANHNIKNKNEYYELCEKDNRLSKDPEIVFKGQFTNWIEYLSIKGKFYDLETCRDKVKKYLAQNLGMKKHYLNLSTISDKLCDIDINFPPKSLWVEYYKVNDLSDIIKINRRKRRGVIL